MTTALSGTNLLESIRFREGELDDCDVLAQLINDSAEGAVEYLLADVSQQSALEVMSAMLAHEVFYSYANTVVAEADGKVVGMVLSFPATGLRMDEQLANHYAVEKVQYINYFVENKIPNCWHLDALCVHQDYRNHGIGGRLLDAVKLKAIECAYPSVGVYVFATNINAYRFYQRHGFEFRKDVNVTEHEFLRDKQKLRLLECAL